MEEAKEAFLREFGEDYGYPNAPRNVDEIRAAEFKRLEGLVYLDHAGATLYSEAQMDAVVKDLTSNVYGNPHSQSDSSLATADMIRAAREQVLDFCNASLKDYRCIFTSGATAALKLVGEAFPWSRESCYMYTLDNHNSVLGIREYALDKGSGAFAIDITKFEKSDISKNCEYSVEAQVGSEQRRFERRISEESLDGNTFSLFAFPSECNFSGTKHSLELVNLVKNDVGRILKDSVHQQYARGNWMVLIDAAKGCATEPPDLAKFPADFVVLSFYKIFGYPTGLGALIIRNDAANLLKKTYFSGGTVSASIADIDFVKGRESVEQLFEDGTASFLSIASIRHGFKIIDTLTISAISRHTSSLAKYVRNKLVDLRHASGVFACVIYGKALDKKATSLHSGPIVAFNLRRSDGSWIGYGEVEKLASISGIQLRTGCFCNPGACAKYVGLSHSELVSNIEAGHVCWDDHDILHGKPTGAVRVSFGYMSTFEDAEKFLRFIKYSFMSERNSDGMMTKIASLPDSMQLSKAPCLVSISVYPIKSCAGFSVDRWPLCDSGLLYDREWLLKSPSGEVLTQKKVPEMCSISSSIDLTKQQLLLESPNCRDKLVISLWRSSSSKLNEDLDMYGERYEVQGYNNNVNIWFSEAIRRPCVLVRHTGSIHRHCLTKDSGKVMCRDVESKLSFVNEAQLLLISADSVSDLDNRIKSGYRKEKPEKPVQIDALRFRPNLVISGAQPYAEDRWRTLHIGQAHFTSLGGCNRCQMINLDPSNAAQRSKEPLATLASFRRVQGKILFGILLRFEERVTVNCKDQDSSHTWLEVGQQVVPDSS